MNEDAALVEIDGLDRRILAILQRDASLTNHALAVAAHTSPATCLRRVQRLVETGVIRQRVALLDAAKLGQSMCVIVEVTLDRQGAEHLDAFERLCVAHPAVRQCHRVSPGPDFVLVALARDMGAWARIVDELFTQQANVRNVKTYFSVRQAKFDTTVDLQADASGRRPRQRPAPGSAG